MATDIGPKIGIDGEKEYRQQINNIITQAKTLSSEMKAVTSSFDKNTTAEEKATKVSEVLSKQIKTQEERVDLLKEMLEKSKEATGENSNETLKWQQAVNNATAELNTMKNKLTDVSEGLDQNTEDIQEVGESTEKAGEKALTFGDIVKANVVSDAIIKGFDALKSAVSELASAFKDMAFESAFYADSILTMSTVTGLSTESLQEFTYMAELVDTSVSTITGSMTKMTKTMASAQNGSKTAQASFEELGVEFLNADGSLRNTEDTFYDIIEALGKVDNEAELDAIAMNIFGKSAKELKPLINAGTEGIEAFRKEAQEMGFVMSEDQLKTLLGVSDAYERFQNQIKTLKNQIAIGLAPALETLMNTLREWVATVDWEAVGEEIGALFGQFVEALTKVDIPTTIKKISDGVVGFVKAVGKINFTALFNGVSSVVNFLNKYGKTLVTVIGTIGGAIAGLKIASLITSIGGIGTAIGALTGPIGIAIGAITAITLIVQNWGTISETAKKLWENAKNAISTTFSNLKASVSNSIETLKSNVSAKFQSMKDGMINTGNNIKNSLYTTFENLKSGLASKVSQIKDTLVNGIQNAFKGIKDLVSNAWQWGVDIINNLTGGMQSKQPAVGETVGNVASTIRKYLHFSQPDVGPLADFNTWMPDMMKGMAEGIEDNSYLVDRAITNLAGGMANGLSPSASSVNYGGVTINLNVPQGTNGRDLVDQIEQELATRMLRRKAVF